MKGGRGQLAEFQPWVYLWVGHFGLGEAGRPGIKNINSANVTKIHFLPMVQPIPCHMGEGGGRVAAPVMCLGVRPWGEGGGS